MSTTKSSFKINIWYLIKSNASLGHLFDLLNVFKLLNVTMNCSTLYFTIDMNSAQIEQQLLNGFIGDLSSNHGNRLAWVCLFRNM